MCNAKKHSAGCSCGFGPPYPPNYQISGITEWAEEIIQHPELIRRGLRETGWDERSIEMFASRYALLQRAHMPRGSLVNSIREFLRMRKRVTEESWIEVVDVPLYRFGAPPVRGAKVEYSEGDTFTGGSGWSLKFRPVGVSSSTSVEVSKSRTFVTTDGATKQVYVPVMVRVKRVAIYDGDELVGHGHEAEVVPPSESGDPLLQKRGIRSAEGATSADGDTPEHHDIVDLALAGDTSGAVHKEKRAWVTDIGREVSLSLGKIANVSAVVRVRRTRRLELAFELPAGHDYRVYLCDGFTQWDSPRGKIAKTSRRSSPGESAA